MMQVEGAHRAFTMLQDVSAAHELLSKVNQGLSWLDVDELRAACCKGRFAPRLREPQFRFLLGVLAANMASVSLPQWMKTTLEPIYSAATPTICYEHTWNLCSDTEVQMRRAVEYNLILAIEGGLILKPKGVAIPHDTPDTRLELWNTSRRTALCVQTIVTSRGTFIRGNWYSPMDRVAKDTVDQDFNSGYRATNNLTGVWALIRSLDQGQAANLLQQSLQSRGFWT